GPGQRSPRLVVRRRESQLKALLAASKQLELAVVPHHQHRSAGRVDLQGADGLARPSPNGTDEGRSTGGVTRGGDARREVDRVPCRFTCPSRRARVGAGAQQYAGSALDVVGTEPDGIGIDAAVVDDEAATARLQDDLDDAVVEIDPALKL